MNSLEELPAWTIIEMVYLCLCFVVGAPLNLLGLKTLRDEQKQGVLRRSDIMRRHLNYSDLLIILLYIPTQLSFTFYNKWVGAEVFCKLVKFVQMLSFQASSTVITCIALDRLLSILSPGRTLLQKWKGMYISMSIAWIYSVLVCSPQFHVFQNFEPEPYQDYKVCWTIWQITRHKNALINETEENATVAQVPRSRFVMESVYGYFSQISNFFLPCLIVVMVYIFIAIWLCRQRLDMFPTLNWPAPAKNTETHTCLSNSRRSTEDRHKKPIEMYSAVAASSSTRICFKPVVEEIHELDAHTPFLPRTVNSSTHHKLIRPLKSDNLLNNRARRKHQRAIRLSAIICLTHLVLWIPYNIVTTVMIVIPDTPKIDVWSYIAHNLIVLNAVFDPFLYGIWKKNA